ncbi:50S ribosome-binding GTPase [Fusobacterium nucleatum]|uniref:GTPase n=1 Tax=Fusobacterium nucleatum TaxID=851 RepID=UPI0030CC670C
MLKLEEYSKEILKIENETKQILKKLKIQYDIAENNKDQVKLVFIGQYSAGKSSILKLLTGRNDIVIGAGITTQRTHEYDWNGLKVVDTPGIHTELNADHDKISYAEIVAADMLVFVITNELFDSHLAEHFRKLAIDKDKGKEMILVVNKMERTANGNTSYQQNIIKEDLEKVLAPFTTEELNLCFLDAESYFESLEEREFDSKIADKLLEKSGYSNFIEILNNFVDKKSLNSKLTTKIYKILNKLEETTYELEPKSTDKDIEALEEQSLQKRHFWVDSKSSLEQEVKNIFTLAVSKIKDLGGEAAEKLYEGCKENETEIELRELISKSNNLIETSQINVKNIVEKRLVEIGEGIDKIENSEFSKQLKINLEGKFEGLPDNIKRMLSGMREGAEIARKGILNNVYGAGKNMTLKLSNLSGSKVHSAILKIGHTIGYKFKPWEAVKFTKGVAIAGNALGILGVGLSIFMQYKSDSDNEKIKEDLRKNRQNIRKEFNSAAYGLEEYAKKYIEEKISPIFYSKIRDIDNEISVIRSNKRNQNQLLEKMEDLKNECYKLIKKIHDTEE